jgi:hypothetical protein
MGQGGSRVAIEIVRVVVPEVARCILYGIDLFSRPPPNPPPPPPNVSVEDMINDARQKYGMDVRNDYNFGVSGPSGQLSD